MNSKTFSAKNLRRALAILVILIACSPTSSFAYNLCIKNRQRVKNGRVKTRKVVVRVDGACPRGYIDLTQIQELDISTASISGSQIQNGSVGTDQIADGAVTYFKLGAEVFAGFSNVAYVGPTSGDYNSPLDAMNDLSSWCGTPGSSNPCLIYLAPGNFDLGGQQLVMQEYVSIKGSGQKLTQIRSNRSAGTVSSSAAAVLAVSDVVLSDLTIANSGDGSSNKIVYGIYMNGSPQIERVEIKAWDFASNTSAGIRGRDSSATLTDVVSSAIGGTNTRGIELWVTGNEIGITLSGVRAQGTNGSNTNYGLIVFGDSGDSNTTVERSHLLGATDGVRVVHSGNSAIVRRSQISGGVSTASSGSLNCVAVTDFNTFYPNTCP